MRNPWKGSVSTFAPDGAKETLDFERDSRKQDLLCPRRGRIPEDGGPGDQLEAK